jgi:PAS domain-containing protein
VGIAPFGAVATETSGGNRDIHLMNQHADSWKRLVAAASRWCRSPLFFVYSIGPVAFGLLCLLRDARLVSYEPLLVYAEIWLGSTALSSGVVLMYRRHPTRLLIHARAAADILAASLWIYVTGWGPALGVVYLVVAENLVADTSRETWPVARAWSIVGILAGQTGIALGWVPTQLPVGAGNGAAVLSAVALILVSRMTETIAADRERAWEEARSHDERFRSLVQSSSDLFVVLDMAGNATYVSGASDRILGITGDELRSLETASLMHPDDIEPVRTVLTEALTRPEPPNRWSSG